MSTITVRAATIDPYYDHEPAIGPNDLARGVRFTLKAIPGTWQVVCEAALENDGFHRVRARERTEGVLVGPVKSIRWTEVKAIVEPKPVAGGSPAAEPAQVETVSTSPPADIPLEPLVVRKPRKVKPAHGTCSLRLTISKVHYQVKPITCDAPAATRCFELRKADGTVYHVSEHAYGNQCTCADFVYAREGKDPDGCKHGKSLQVLGLLSGVAVEAAAVEPDPDPLSEPSRLAAEESAADLAIHRGMASPRFPDHGDAPAMPEPTDGPGDEDWADYGRWSSDLDGAREDDRPEPEPRNPLADYLLDQAAQYRLTGTPWAVWLARQIEALAAEARALDATTPEDFDDRSAAMHGMAEDDHPYLCGACGHSG